MTEPSKGKLTNGIELLKADHRQVKGLFEQFRAAGERAHKKKQGIAEQVFAALEVHTTIEEEILYPAVRQASKDLADHPDRGMASVEWSKMHRSNLAPR